MLSAPKPCLYQQLVSLPENLIGEIVNGQLYAHPRPSPPHAIAASNLGADLIDPYGRGRGGPGGWWIIDEPELHLAHETLVLVPDIAGWHRRRMPSPPETAYFELSPDWICEVLSPSTESYDREVKMPAYAKYSVPYAWLVDPLKHTLETYELEKGEWIQLGTFKDHDQVSATPFNKIVINLDDLWI